MTTPDAETFDLVLERRTDAAPELVWRCWTQAEHLEKWFAPRPLTTRVHAMETHPGGAFRATMTAPDGATYPVNGCYLELVENRRLVFTDALEAGWRPAAEPFFTAIVTLEPDGSGTRYTARALHRNAEDRDRHAEMGFHDGWGQCFDQLVEVALGLAG